MISRKQVFYFNLEFDGGGDGEEDHNNWDGMEGWDEQGGGDDVPEDCGRDDCDGGGEDCDDGGGDDGGGNDE